MPGTEGLPGEAYERNKNQVVLDSKFNFRDPSGHNTEHDCDRREHS